MQTVSPKLSDRIIQELIGFAGNKNAGAVEAIEAYSYIRRATLTELKKILTLPEAKCLIDMHNGTLLSPELQYQPEVLRAKIEDAERYEGTCSKYGVDMRALLAKTDRLTAAQVWVLQQESVRTWNQDAEDSNSMNKMLNFLSEK